MKRRDFNTALLIASTVIQPLLAQESAKRRRIALVAAGGKPENVSDALLPGFIPPDYAAAANQVGGAAPQIVFTQGNVSGTVPGGEMAVVWSDLTLHIAPNGAESGGGFLIDTSRPDQGVATPPAAAAYVVRDNVGGPITDATAAGKPTN